MIIYGGYDAERCAAILKQYHVPVIIASTYRLPLRRDDPYDAAYTLARSTASRRSARLRSVDRVPVLPGAPPVHATCHITPPLRLPTDFPSAMQFARSPFRLPRFSVLPIASVRSPSARTRRLLITDGDILETETHVTDAYIQGRKVDLGSRHKMLYEKYKQKYAK